MEVELKHGEKIITVIRRHSIAFWIEVLLLFIAGFIPTLFSSFFYEFYHIDLISSHYVIYEFFYSLWLLLLLFLIVIAWSDYYLDSWILTTHRAIDVEQIKTFERKVIDYYYSEVSDVVSKKRVFMRFFKFGDIKVIYKNGDNFKIKEVSNSEEIAEIIKRECGIIS